MYTVVCICIFQASRLGERLKDYPIFQEKPCLNLELDTKYKPQRISYSRRKITEYIVEETLIQVGSEHIWLWVAIEPKNKEILALTISKEGKCLLRSGLFQVWFKFTESIQYQQIKAPGTNRRAGFSE